MNPKFALVGLGAVLVLVTLASIFGLIPSLTVAGLPSACAHIVPGPTSSAPSGACAGSLSLTVSFTITQASLVLNLTDTTAHAAGLVLSSGVVTWGDGSNATLPAFGAVLSHTYAAAGQYTVNERVTAKGCSGTVVSGGTCVTQAGSASKGVTMAKGQNSTGGSGGSGYVQPAFSYVQASSTSYAVTFTDETSYSNVTVTAISFAFGDGTTGGVAPPGGSSNPVGGTATHTYATAGSFNVTETVSWTSTAGTAYTSSVSHIVTISGPSGCTSTCPVTSSPGLNVASGLLLFAGIGLVILPLATNRYEIVGIGVVLLMVAGAAAGYYF